MNNDKADIPITGYEKILAVGDDAYKDLSPDQILSFLRIGKLATGMIHDLNNRMCLLYHQIELIRLDCQKGSMQEKHLENLHDLLRENAAIIKRTTKWAQANEIDKQKTNLNRLIGQTIENLTLLPDAHNVKFTQELPPDPIILALDETQIKRVLMNLLMNALHAIHESGTGNRIKITLCEDKKRAFMVLSDNGPGIPNAVLDNIGKPYISTRKSCGGSGLGIMIAQQIINMHRGELVICNGTAGGAKFIVTLPFQNANKFTKKPSPER